MFRSTGCKTLHFLRFFVFLLVLFQGSQIVASAPSSLSSGLFNKVVAVLTDLSFRQDQAYDFLIPNEIMSEVNGPEIEINSRQRARSIYQTAALQHAMTTGIVFYQTPSDQLACLDSAAEMQALYNHYVFPLDQAQPKEILSSSASCLVDIEPQVQNKISSLSHQQPLTALLKSIWIDSLRAASCSFETWTKADNAERGGECQANDAYKLGKKILEDELAVSDFFENLPPSYGLGESMQGMIAQLSSLKGLLDAYPAGVQTSSGENVCFISSDSSSSACPLWVKNNWLSITNPLGETLLFLKEIMQSVLASIDYHAVENTRSIEKRYSIEELLNPNGYEKAKDRQNAVDLVTVLANAAQLPSILLPDVKPVSYDSVPGRCSNKNIFYYSGGQIGGDYSVHDTSGQQGKPICAALTFSQQSKINTRRTKVYMDMIEKSEKFKKNMRTLVAGQTFLLSNFYDAISRRSSNPYLYHDLSVHSSAEKEKAKADSALYSYFIRPDWRTVGIPFRASSDDSSRAFQTFGGGQAITADQAAIKRVQAGVPTKVSARGSAAPPRVGDGLAWRAAMETAAPSVIQRETLFTIADIIAAMYQTQEIQEKKLLTYSFQALQFLSGSSLVSSGHRYKDRMNQALGRYVTGSPAWEIVGKSRKKQKAAVQEILDLKPSIFSEKYTMYRSY